MKGYLIMKKEDFYDKKVSEFSDENTSILGGPYRKGYDILSESFRGTFGKGVSIANHEDMTVVETESRDFTDMMLYLKSGKLVAIWTCYDLMDWNVNWERGYIESIGHETIQKYWIKDGEFEQRYTR